MKDELVLELQEPPDMPECPRDRSHIVRDISYYNLKGEEHEALCLECGRHAFWTPQSQCWEWKERPA